MIVTETTSVGGPEVLIPPSEIAPELSSSMCVYGIVPLVTAVTFSASIPSISSQSVVYMPLVRVAYIQRFDC